MRVPDGAHPSEPEKNKQQCTSVRLLSSDLHSKRKHQSMNQAARITHGNGATCAGLNPKQRWGALIAGGSLTLLGLSRRSASGLALAAAGGALVYAGARTKLPDHFEAASSLLLNCTPEEAFRLWRNFKDLPLFMYHLESVTQIGDGRYRWIAAGPFG